MKTITQILKRLEKEFPDPKLELDHENPLQLLVATVLSAQCTDKKVNEVTAKLFQEYRSAEDFANADLKTLEQEVKATGFYRKKAAAIKTFAKEIAEQHGGEVPNSQEILATMPGVGRKTGNLVLGTAFGTPAIAVDTHVHRVSLRLGLARSRYPDKVELELCKQIPKQKWALATNLFILHGRYVCRAKKPLCDECVIEDLCESEDKVVQGSLFKLK